MTYKTIAPNVLADEFGHKVRILGRTGILHSFAGRDIQIDSEILAAGFGFAIYGDWSRLISPGSGGPDLQDEEVVSAIDEIVKALRDIGEIVEIATHYKRSQ